MGPEYELVGLFHDLVEDTPCTLDDIRETWGATIADGVAAMTHREDEDYFGEYLPRVMQNFGPATGHWQERIWCGRLRAVPTWIT